MSIKVSFTQKEIEILSAIVFNTRGEFLQYCNARYFKSADIDSYAKTLFEIYSKLLIPDANKTKI